MAKDHKPMGAPQQAAYKCHTCGARSSAPGKCPSDKTHGAMKQIKSKSQF